MTAVAPEVIEEIQSRAKPADWPDVEIPCEWGEAYRLQLGGQEIPTQACDRPAAWIMWRGCCMDKSKYRLFCTPHKDDVLASDATIYCAYCDTAWSPARRIFMLIEPINKRPEG